jgi:hypothetical protein
MEGWREAVEAVGSGDKYRGAWVAEPDADSIYGHFGEC